MKRESVNPWEWGLAYSMDQGELVQGVERILNCSGQVAVDPDPSSEMGIAVVGEGDIRAQIQKALENVDAVLEKGGLGRANVLTLRFFTTDIDGFLENYDVYADWIAPAGTRPPQSLIGVARLVDPRLLVEIEATAGA